MTAGLRFRSVGLLTLLIGTIAVGWAFAAPAEPLLQNVTPVASAPAAGQRPAARPTTAARPGVPGQTGPRGAVASRPATAPAGPPPKWRCEETTHDFGEVWAGDKVEHTYYFFNDGPGELEISVRTTCGCTVANDYDRKLAPGAKGHITAILTTAPGYEQVHKPLIVTTNDPTQQSVTLNIQGKIKERIAFQPRPLGAYFGSGQDEASRTRVFTLTNNMPTPMKLELVPPPTSQPFSATIKELEPGKTAEVTVKAIPPFKDGLNSGQIQVKTGAPEHPTMVIPCSLSKPPAIDVPTVFRLATAPLPQMHRRPFMVRFNESGDLKITKASCTDPAVKVELAETRKGKEYSVTLEFPQGYSPSLQSPPNVILETDYAARPTITLPIVASSQPLPLNQLGQQNTPVMNTESLIGRPAPGAMVPDAVGGRIRVGAGNGRVSVINFFGVWDPVSRRQAAMLDRLWQANAKRNVEFVSVSVDQLRPPSEVQDLARKNGVRMPIGLDNSLTVARLYGVNRLPTMLIVGKDGIVEAVHPGIGRTTDEIARQESAIQKEVDSLLDGKTRSSFAQSLPGAGQVTALALPPVQAAQPVGPSLIVDGLHQDMGLLKPGADVEFKLYVRNGGTAPLEIQQVSASEGMTIDQHQPSVAPGANASMTCRIKTPTKPDAIAGQVTLTTNDTARPKVVVALTGQVRPWIEVDPPSGIDFSDRARTHKVPRIATLVYNGPGEIKYSAAKSSSPKFEAELRPTRNPAYTMVIVKTVGNMDLGENAGVIQIESDCKEQPAVEVPVKLMLPPRISVQPAAALLGPGASPQRAELTITNNGDRSLSIMGVKPSSASIRWQFYPEPDGQSYRLLVNVMPPYKPGPNDSITIRTDDAEFGELVIPVRSAAQVVNPAPAPAQRARGSVSL